MPRLPRLALPRYHSRIRGLRSHSAPTRGHTGRLWLSPHVGCFRCRFRRTLIGAPAFPCHLWHAELGRIIARRVQPGHYLPSGLIALPRLRVLDWLTALKHEALRVRECARVEEYGNLITICRESSSL